MGSKVGPQLKASLGCGTGATWSSSCSSSAVWPEAKEDSKKKPAARARKPKRTSFACLECSKTFPTQQAMAGHCSAHTRAGAARRVPVVRLANHLPATAPVAVVAPPSIPLPLPPHNHSVNAVQYWTPQQVQVAPSTNPMPPPPLAIRYVPYARPASNQIMARLPLLDLHGRRSSRRQLATTDPATNTAFRPVAWPMPTVPASGRLGWRAFVPFYGAPLHFSVNGAPPSDAASSTERPGHTRAADLTLRLGSRRAHAQRRTLPLLRSLVASDGQQSADRKCKLATTDGGDKIQAGGLDLELRLYG